MAGSQSDQTEEETESPPLSRIKGCQVSSGPNPSAAAGGHTGALIGHLESALKLGEDQATGHRPADKPGEADKLASHRPNGPAAKEVDESHPPPIENEQEPLTSSASVEAAPPTISFGRGAPHPRWIFVEARTSQDASSPAGQAAVKAIQPPPQPGAAAIGAGKEGGSESSGMGILAWVFEPGPEETRDGLTLDQLYVNAYKALERVLDDPITRERLRDAIRSSKLAPKVSRIEDPLPPLPPAPNMGYGTGQFRGAFDPGYNYLSYARPSLARRKNDNAKSPPSDLLTKIRAHSWEDSLSPVPELESTGTSEVSGGGFSSNDENSRRQTSETTQAARSSVQWLDGTVPAPIGGVELVDVSASTRDEALSYFNRENGETYVPASLVILDENLSQMLISMPSAATRNQAVAEESTSPASTIKVPRRESLKTATGLKRKREGDARPATESASAKNPQRTATPPGEAGPNGQPGRHQEQSSGRRQLATFVPAKRAARKSRKRAAENTDIPPRRNPPRKAKKT